MISSIEITRFRGIREGKLEDLTPLVVLVGPNATGKSTVLDAMLIAASRTPGQAIERAVTRRWGVRFGAPWLLWRRNVMGPAQITLVTNYDTATESGLQAYSRGIALELSEQAGAHLIRGHFHDNSYQKTFESDQVEVVFSLGRRRKHSVSVEAYCLMSSEEFPGTKIVGGIRTGADTPLYKLIDQALDQGLLTKVTEIVQAVVPGLKKPVIGVEGERPLAKLDYGDHAVPVALCGDGICSLLWLGLELATHPQGTVLLEEPEVHQHPRAIGQTIRAVLAAVRRDIQVVMTTHSLELIDYLVAESSEEDIQRLSLYRLELENGNLISVRKPGPEVAFSRCEIEKDLR